MSSLPTTVRHYHRRARRPFLNLSDLPEDELERVRSELVEEQRAGLHDRTFGARYMQLRRRTEEKLRDLFIRAGGEPERPAPHYFVLGESQWFAGLAPDMTHVELQLADLPDEATSFTHPDSFTAMALGPEFGLPYEPRACHEQVFRLADLERIVAEYGVPDDPGPHGYDGYAHRPFEMYIEIQLWTDGPIAALL